MVKKKKTGTGSLLTSGTKRSTTPPCSIISPKAAAAAAAAGEGLIEEGVIHPHQTQTSSPPSRPPPSPFPTTSLPLPSSVALPAHFTFRIQTTDLSPVPSPGEQGGNQFWSGLSIEIEKPYGGKSPKWHRDSESTATSNNDRSHEPHTGGGGRGDAEGDYNDGNDLEPRVLFIITRCAACALAVVGIAQVTVQVLAFAQLHYYGTFWAGLFSLLVGLIGFIRHDCIGIYHRAFSIVGILINAIGAVLDSRVDSILHRTTYCGPPSAASGDSTYTLGQWCSINHGCGCIIPGSDGLSRDSCILYNRGKADANSSEQCHEAFLTLINYLDISMSLCWTLATICLSAFLARAFISCLIKLLTAPSGSSRSCSSRNRKAAARQAAAPHRQPSETRDRAHLSTLLIPRREGVLTPIF